VIRHGQMITLLRDEDEPEAMTADVQGERVVIRAPGGNPMVDGPASSVAKFLRFREGNAFLDLRSTHAEA
jgi:hypothetical protein